MNGKGTILGKAFANGTTINPALTIQDINGKYLHDSFLNKLDDIILPINSINKNYIKSNEILIFSQNEFTLLLRIIFVNR